MGRIARPMISGHLSACIAPALLPAEAAVAPRGAGGEGTRTDPVDEALARSDSPFRSPGLFAGGERRAVGWGGGGRRGMSLGFCGMGGAAFLGAPAFFPGGAWAFFLGKTATTVCLGHSLGMHRR